MPKLVIVSGEGDRREVELTTRELRLGRAPENDVALPDPSKGVSRMHAQLRYENGRYVIVDLNSQNGTWINDARVERADLASGSVVAIGPYRITLEGDGVSPLEEFHRQTVPPVVSDASTEASTVRHAVVSHFDTSPVPEVVEQSEPVTQSGDECGWRSGVELAAMSVPASVATEFALETPFELTAPSETDSPTPEQSADLSNLAELATSNVGAPEEPTDQEELDFHPEVATESERVETPEFSVATENAPTWSLPPAEAATPIEPASPIEPAAPIEPASPIEPEKPIEVTTSTEAALSNEAIKSTEPAQLAETEKPAEPAKSRDPESSAEPKPAPKTETQAHSGAKVAPPRDDKSARARDEKAPATSTRAPKRTVRPPMPPPAPARNSTAAIFGGLFVVALLLIAAGWFYWPSGSIAGSAATTAPATTNAVESVAQIIAKDLADAKTLIQKNEFDAALRNNLDRALLLDPANKEALDLKAKALAGIEQQKQEAAAAAAAAATAAPKPPPAPPARASAPPAANARGIARGPENLPSARRPNETVQAWRTRNTALQTQYDGAKAAFNRRQYAAAVTGFEAVVKAEPKYLDAAQMLTRARAEAKTTGRDSFEAANKLDAAGRWTQALEQYDRARQLDPSLRGQVDEAVRRVRTKMRGAGGDAFKRARQYDALGRSADALKEYENAAQWLPADDANRAVARQRADELKTAAKK